MAKAAFSRRAIFRLLQRLAVPFFRGPHAWNEELLCEALWGDLQRIVEKNYAGNGMRSCVGKF
jgi:hypothetical protein